MISRILALFLLLSSPVIWGQTRYQSGEFKGFTKWQWETLIIYHEKPFVVRQVDGTVYIEEDDTNPLDGVFIELRGPGRSRKIRSVRTDTDGKFRLSKTPPGRYMFKAATKGFNTIVGIIIVSPEAAPDQVINLHMSLGT
jgi:hypothetical protein